MAPEGGEIIPDLRQFRHEFHSYNLLLVPEYRFRTPGSQFLGLISWLPVPFMGHKIGDLLLWLFQPYLPYNPFTAVFLFCSKFRKKYVVIRSIMQTIFLHHSGLELLNVPAYPVLGAWCATYPF